MLFAQMRGPVGGESFNQGPDETFFAFLIIFIVIAFAIGLTVQIFYLLTLSRCYSRISPRHRRMEPGQVWLNLIPIFGVIWIFFTTIRLADSLSNEYRERRLRGDGDFGRSLGITYPILFLASALPCIGGFVALGGMVCWIMYWVKIAGYSRQLLEDNSDLSVDRDWDDERGRFPRHDRGDDGFAGDKYTDKI